MTEESRVSGFYAGKKILITGGTGLMGKVLIWKLLQSCPQLDVIYVLVRTKRDRKLASRKEELLHSPIFDNFKKEDPGILDKLVFISGDVGEQGVALSDADRSLLVEHVSIVFHGAAVLRMNADLRTAININTEGTMRMLDLALQMKKLETFAYISTAYCCCDNSTVEEQIYPSKHDPYDVINLVRWMDAEMLEKVTPNLIYPLPNTYTYSKRLTESLLLNYKSKIPIIVARPTIVIAAYKEPIPGWNDQLFGLTGLFIAGGKGALRITMMNGKSKSNIVYVDTAINAILTLPWANTKDTLLKEIAVYNISQSALHHLTWEQITKMLTQSFIKRPFEIILWYPSENFFTDSILVYTFKSIFCHYLPAYIIDFILTLIGQKRFLVRVQDKLKQGERVLRYFTLKNWSFSNEKIHEIENQLSEADKRVFTVTMKEYTDFQTYLDNGLAVTRRHVFHEDDNTIRASKIRLNIIYILDKIFLVLRYYLLWKLIVFIFNVFIHVNKLYQY